MENVIAGLKRELETTHKLYSHCIQELEDKAKENKAHLDEKTMEVEFLLEDSKNKIKELEEASKAKFRKWLDKENQFKNFIHSQLQSMQV